MWQSKERYCKVLARILQVLEIQSKKKLKESYVDAAKRLNEHLTYNIEEIWNSENSVKIMIELPKRG